MSTVDSSSTSAADGETSVSFAVVEAVSAAVETPPLELPPLARAIDPDALNALFTDSRPGSQVEFRYAGCVVTVRSDRTVTVSADD
ncbi:hypothetical protein SAMN04488063_1431 [Halopelagius inordinatus]|uniref:Halobacterial output domain-containing protein n=1 Tax=Halopelagius inordinatus TaxID=553467 RepID=A0A1I2P8Z0_9EURY|nr:HalOD1 output domain-containing protein [Halopelagius inordinatus]SFG10417.1 hypothetical protein SAMN04488063_1431 [Halopelagius inordinatus]